MSALAASLAPSPAALLPVEEEEAALASGHLMAALHAAAWFVRQLPLASTAQTARVMAASSTCPSRAAVWVQTSLAPHSS